MVIRQSSHRVYSTIPLILEDASGDYRLTIWPLVNARREAKFIAI